MFKKLHKTHIQKFFFSTRRRTNLTDQYEIEREEYEKKMKEYRQRHREEFWAAQSEIENKWIEEFLKTQKEKKVRDDAKLRSTIIRNSMACYNNIVRIDSLSLETNDRGASGIHSQAEVLA
jgi:hypothetical protein